MEAIRTIIRVPSVTLQALLGEGSINAASFRRAKIERFWPCGCLASYAYDKFDDVEWTACDRHAPPTAPVS